MANPEEPRRPLIPPDITITPAPLQTLPRDHRTSCLPNTELQEYVNVHGIRGYQWNATRDIELGEKIMIPFLNATIRTSDVPLDCAIHADNINECPQEQERQRHAAQRAPRNASYSHGRGLRQGAQPGAQPGAQQRTQQAAQQAAQEGKPKEKKQRKRK